MLLPKERNALGKISPYKAARTLESVKREYGVESIIKLAGNENRLGCSTKVAQILQKQQEQYSFYPDMNCTILREKLSKLHDVEGGNLIFGNGSFELISLLALAYLEEGEESIIPVPSFGWYHSVTLQMNAKPVLVPLQEFGLDLEKTGQLITEKTKIIWICNPNNPTGTVLKSENLLNFIGEVPKTILIVLDEAYIDFIEGGYIDTVEIVRNHKNVILLRTFSKLYGLASLRLGYGIADKEIIEKLNRIRLPINVNFAAQKAAEVSLEDEDFKQLVLKNNRNSLELYYQELDKAGIEYVRSNGNFILVHTGLDGTYVERSFLTKGIMIRNAAEFGLDGWIRISIGTFEENQKVIKVLIKLVKENKNKI